MLHICQTVYHTGLKGPVIYLGAHLDSDSDIAPAACAVPSTWGGYLVVNCEWDDLKVYADTENNILPGPAALLGEYFGMLKLGHSEEERALFEQAFAWGREQTIFYDSSKTPPRFVLTPG